MSLTGSKGYDGTAVVAGSLLSVANTLPGDSGNVSVTGTGGLASRNAGPEAISEDAVPTLVQSAAVASSGGTITVTLPSAPLAGDTLIVIQSANTSYGYYITNVIGGGGTWARVNGINSSGSGDHVTTDLWYAPNVSGGAGLNTITITNFGANAVSVVALEYAGLSASPLDVSADGRANSGAASVSATTTLPNELCVAGFGSWKTIDTPTGGFALVTNAANVASVYAMQYLSSTAGTVTAGGTLSTADQYAAVMACFKVAPPLALTGSAAGNYTLAGMSGSVTVNKENLTVTAVTATKAYDGTTSATNLPVITTGSIMGGDTADFIETYATTNEGAGITLTPSGIVSDGNGGANYNYTFDAVASGIITSGTSEINTNSFAFTNLVTGSSLNLSWPLDHKGWRLQVQTNSPGTGLSTTWYDWPNSTNLTSVSVPIDPANASVFLRMVYP